MESTSTRQQTDAGLEGGKAWRSLALSSLVAALALAGAFFGALLLGDDQGVDGVNAFVEGLSARSGTFLGGASSLIPLGFAFAAGMVSTVNPCGFAMLPVYLGLYLGSQEQREGRTSPTQRLGRAFAVGGTVTVGFVLLFGIVGVVIGAGAQALVDIFPWIGLGVGVLLVIAGAWMLSGNKLYSGVAARVASRIGDPSQVGIRGYFLFGISYGTASLSCTLPIFLAVVGSALAVGGALAAIGQFVLYALGMGTIIMFLTLALALFKGAMVGLLRRALPYIEPVSAGLLVLAGSYIVFYWLSVGGLL